MENINNIRKKTKTELKALAKKYTTKNKALVQSHIQTQPTVEPLGSSGTDELEKRDYGYDWFGNKSLHPDQYWPGG
jgi:hypothetical protein